MAKRQAPPITTQDELALLLDRDKSRISRYLRDERWPFSRRAPWLRSDLPKMLRWLADNLESVEPPESGSGDEMADLRKQKLKEEIRKLHHQANAAEIEYEQVRGSVVGVEEVKRQWVRVAGVYTSQLQGMAASVAPLCEGRNAAEIQDEIEKYVSTVLANVRGSLDRLAGGNEGTDAPTGEDEAERMGGEVPDDAGGSDSGTGTVAE